MGAFTLGRLNLFSKEVLEYHEAKLGGKTHEIGHFSRWMKLVLESPRLVNGAADEQIDMRCAEETYRLQMCIFEKWWKFVVPASLCLLAAPIFFHSNLEKTQQSKSRMQAKCSFCSKSRA